MGETTSETSPQIEETTDPESMERVTVEDVTPEKPPEEDEMPSLKKSKGGKGGKDKGTSAPLLRSKSSLTRKKRKSIEPHDLPHDLPFSITFVALFVLVLVREIYLFGPLVVASFIRLPFAALGLLPALLLGTLLALLGFYLLLRAIRHITPKTLKIFAIALVLLYSVFGGVSLWYQLTHPTPDILKTSHLAGSACVVLISFSVFVSLFAYRKHIPMVAGVMGDTAEFLLTQGMGVLLLTALAGFIQGLFFFFPLAMAGIAFSVDCAVPAETAFHEVRQHEAEIEASSPGSHVSINELLSMMRVFSMDHKCQPWASALFPDVSSSAVFFSLSAFLFLWLLALVAHLFAFLSCFILHRIRVEKHSESGAPRRPSVLSQAFRAGFSDSFGSLCFSSFLAAFLSVGYVVARVVTFFYMPATWPKYIPPILVSLMLLNFILLQTAINHFLVPGLAVFGSSVHGTCVQVWALVYQQFHQTSALELSYLPVHTLLAFPVSLLLVLCGALVSAALVASTSTNLLVPIIVIVVLGPCVLYLVFTGIVHSTIICCFMSGFLEGRFEKDLEAAPLVEKDESAADLSKEGTAS